MVGKSHPDEKRKVTVTNIYESFSYGFILKIERLKIWQCLINVTAIVTKYS